MFSDDADYGVIALYSTHLTVREGSIFCGLSDISLYSALGFTFFLTWFEGLGLEDVHEFKILNVQKNYLGNL